MKTLFHQLFVAALLGVAFAMIPRAGAQTTTWTGASTPDQNWSTAGNWTTVGGSTPPGAADTVVFGAGAFPASTNTAGSVDSIVSASTTVGGLQYINTSGTTTFHTTQINAGQTLTVNGLFAAGVAGQTTVAAMSGAGNFTVNNVTGNFNVGGGGISTATVTVTLADGTNTINVKTLSLSESGSNNGRPCTLNLGAGPTFINADNINLGTGKGQTTTIQWLNPAFTNGIVIRNTAGTGRATFLMGSGSSASGSPNAQLLLAGHHADILAGLMTMGKSSGSSTATSKSTTTFDNGIIDATSIIMGDVTATTLPAGGAQVNPAILNVGGSTNTATLIVNSPSGPGGGVFMVGDSLTNHTANVAVNIKQNGNAQVYCSIVKAQSAFPTFNTAVITITNGALNMEAATNTIGVAAFPIDTMALDNATLQLFENGSSLNAAVVNLTLAETNVFNIGALPIISSLPTVIPVITYTSLTSDGNASNLFLGTLPGSYGGYLTNDTVGTISLVITSGPITTKADQWGGGANNNWDTTSLNWTNAGTVVKYAEGDFVTFDDFGKTNKVNLTGSRSPGSLTVTNNALNYTLSGPGAISGLTSLVKSGAGSLTLSESGGDNFAAGITVHGGTLVLDNPNSSISGGLTNDSGSVVQIGNNDPSGALPAGGLLINGSLVFNQTSNRTVAAIIPGAGSLTQNGSNTLTLTAANTYSGNTVVGNGTLALAGNATVASPLIRVLGGGTLNISHLTVPAVVTNAVALTNGNLNVGAGTNSPSVNTLSVSNSTIILVADYANSFAPVLSTTAFTSGGTTNIMNVVAIQNLPLSPTVPFSIPLVGYTTATFNGGFNFGWTNLTGLTGYISNNPVNLTIDLVITSAPQNLIWSGGSATVNNWSDAANWSGTAITPLDALTFAGNVRTNNLNDTASGTTYAGVIFDFSASSFTLGGAPINLAGTMVNNSPFDQTVNLGLALTGNAVLDGGFSASLVMKGGVTNTSASDITVTNLGNGTINDLWSSTSGGQLEFQVTGSGVWTILDGTGSGALVQAGNVRLHVNPTTGEYDFGTSNSAPNVDLGFTTNSSLAIDGSTAGTFNMNNGTLKVNAMTSGGNGAQHGLFNLNGGTLILGSGGFVAGSGSGGSSLVMSFTNGSAYNTNGGPFTLTQRSPASINLAGGLLQSGPLELTSGQTIGGNGIVNLIGGTLACTNVSVGSSGANAWGLINYNGGTLKLAATSVNFFKQNNSAGLTNVVQAGGAVVDTAGFSTAFNSPFITDPALLGSPDGGLTKLGAGTLTLSSANSYVGSNAVIAGTLAVNGSVLGDVIVGGSGTLGGTGSVGGQVTANGTIAPGSPAATGTLTVLSNATLTASGTAAMKLNKNALTNDVLAVAGTLTYNGTLSLNNLSGTLAGGDTFKLFNAGTYAGGFTTVVPATPGAGLAWTTNNLTVNGTIGIVSTGPTTNANITSVKLIGGNIVIHGTNNNGGQNFHYAVLASTNIAAPVSTWTILTTNPFNVDGTFDYTNAAGPTPSQRYFDVKAVP